MATAARFLRRVAVAQRHPRFMTSVAESKEAEMRKTLVTALNASFVKVEDISGGCGSMYKLEVESPEFVGKTLVNQHKLVTNALKAEIGEMHGLTIQTRRPRND